MATTLTNTEISDVTASGSVYGSSILCSGTESIQEWCGSVTIASGASVYLFYNPNNYNRTTGIIHFTVTHSSTNKASLFSYNLSRYELSTTSILNSATFSTSLYTDPGDANINYLKFQNDYTESGTYYFNVQNTPGNSGINSTYLTKIK